MDTYLLITFIYLNTIGSISIIYKILLCVNKIKIKKKYTSNKVVPEERKIKLSKEKTPERNKLSNSFPCKIVLDPVIQYHIINQIYH